jgi:hypothetical protein
MSTFQSVLACARQLSDYAAMSETLLSSSVTKNGMFTGEYERNLETNVNNVAARLLSMIPFARNPSKFQLSDFNKLSAILLLNLAKSHSRPFVDMKTNTLMPVRDIILPTFGTIIENIVVSNVRTSTQTWAEECVSSRGYEHGFLRCLLVGMMRLSSHTRLQPKIPCREYDVGKVLIVCMVKPLLTQISATSFNKQETVDCVLVLSQVLGVIGECDYYENWLAHIDTIVDALVAVMR